MKKKRNRRRDHYYQHHYHYYSLATNQQQTIMPVSVGWGSKMGRLFLVFFFFFLLSQVLCCLLLDFIVSHSFSPKKKGEGKHYTKLISLQPTTSTTSEILIHSLNLFFFEKLFFLCLLNLFH